MSALQLSSEPTFSQDHLLCGRVTLRQPLKGYRVAIDPVFLAAAIQPLDGQTVLDVGAGVGAASFCLASRVKGCRVIGLEVQRDYVRLAAQNVELNQMQGRVEVLFGDLLRAPPRLAAGTFDHVMSNPPYLEEYRANASPTAEKNLANTETDADLHSWARFCLMMVKPKGTLTFIHRADRLDHILGFLGGKLGDITVYPLWPGQGKAAKRVIVRGVRNSNAPLTLHPGMILHEKDGRFSSMAEEILRDGKGIEW